jgi:hypothetical protein
VRGPRYHKGPSPFVYYLGSLEGGLALNGGTEGAGVFFPSDRGVQHARVYVYLSMYVCIYVRTPRLLVKKNENEVTAFFFGEKGGKGLGSLPGCSNMREPPLSFLYHLHVPPLDSRTFLKTHHRQLPNQPAIPRFSFSLSGLFYFRKKRLCLLRPATPSPLRGCPTRE